MRICSSARQGRERNAPLLRRSRQRRTHSAAHCAIRLPNLGITIANKIGVSGQYRGGKPTVFQVICVESCQTANRQNCQSTPFLKAFGRSLAFALARAWRGSRSFDVSGCASPSSRYRRTGVYRVPHGVHKSNIHPLAPKASRAYVDNLALIDATRRKVQERPQAFENGLWFPVDGLTFVTHECCAAVYRSNANSGPILRRHGNAIHGMCV